MITSNQSTEFQYKPLYKPNQLILGTGQTAIVTGWTVKNSVAKKLQPHEYAVIGQLYSSTRGISFLLRNLLANPHVRFLVVLNATKEDRNSGACECLLDFFRYGFKIGKSDTGKDCWLISSSRLGYIDIEIESDALEKLREAIDFREASSMSETIDRVRSLTNESIVKPWGNPLVFPDSEVITTVFPGNRYGHRVEAKTIAETWVKIIHRIRTTGTIRPTGYDGKWQELIDLIAVVTDEPDNFYYPEPNYLPIDQEFIQEYITQILNDSPYQEGVKYTYAQRLRSWFGRDQIEDVINKLIQEIDAASAVMNLWDSGGNIQRRPDGSSDHQHSGSPCLNHIWVRVVENELSLTATLRSNDMFSAWPANAMGLRALQQYIRDEIARRSDYNLSMGPLITISQSAHIYDDTWENADQLIQTEYSKLCQGRNYDDPVGSFVISVQNCEIIVEHITPGSGDVVNCYSGKSARKLYFKIAEDCPSLQVEHALYLGTELQKAEIALSIDTLVYKQDQPLINCN